MNRKKRLLISICILIITVLSIPATEAEAENLWYTYTYDYFDDEIESPDAYVPSAVYTGTDLGVGNFKTPQSMFTIENMLYIVDSGNNRIVQLSCTNGKYSCVRIIDSFTLDNEILTLNYPTDIFVKDNGELFIADNKNYRILHADAECNIIKIIDKPEDETISDDFEFLPSKLIVDASGRIYLQATNVNKGLMEFDGDGNFTGYVGASEVKFDMVEYIWKLISTKEQKSQMTQFVPTEYNNVALDSEGFMYVTTSVFDENELRSDQAKPIRRLNSMGTDILIKNGKYPPIGDLWWGRTENYSGSSRFVDIVAFENDTYYAIDQVRGRIFAYDFQGNMLYAFGGPGNKQGYFSNPSAIDKMGDNLLVLDYGFGTLTVLTITDYGKLINEGLALYKKGDYDGSAEKWTEVLKLNGNYDLAYIGIGRALLRQGEYKKAMEYFELKHDDVNYSKAYKLYRKEWIEEYIGIIFIVILIILLIPAMIGIVKKIRKEANEGYENIGDYKKR